MFKQFLQNSIAILQRPTVKSFQAVNVDNWQQAFVYLASSAVLKWLIVVVSNVIHAPAREKQLSEASQHLRVDLALSLHHSLQNPLVNLVVWIVLFLFGIMLWFLLPYWLGRALGGSKSFGKFAYNNSLFMVPLGLLNALLNLALSGLSSGLYMLLFFSLYAFYFYLVYINLQATMDLSKGKSLLTVAFPILLTFVLFCGAMSFLIIASFRG